MKQFGLSKHLANIRHIAYKHSPTILMGVGIAGMVTSTVMAVRVTPKALMLLEEHKIDEEEEDLSVIDTIKTTWHCYIPSVMVCVGSITCLIYSSSINLRRNAVIATAYSLSENALKEYQEKVVETIGEKKEHTIRDAVAKDRINKDPVSNKEIHITNSGNTLCYDVISGRYFESDIELIRKAVNELNRNMLNDMYISLNDFYYELGLSNNELGDDLGWNISDGFIELNFSTQLSDNGRPCLVINYLVTPKYDFATNY